MKTNNPYIIHKHPTCFHTSPANFPKVVGDGERVSQWVTGGKASLRMQWVLPSDGGKYACEVLVGAHLGVESPHATLQVTGRAGRVEGNRRSRWRVTRKVGGGGRGTCRDVGQV